MGRFGSATGLAGGAALVACGLLVIALAPFGGAWSTPAGLAFAVIGFALAATTVVGLRRGRGGAAALLGTDRHQPRPRQRKRQRPWQRGWQRLSHRPRLPPVCVGARSGLQRKACHRTLAGLARSARVPRVRGRAGRRLD